MIDYQKFINLCLEKHGQRWNSIAVKREVIKEGFPYPWSMLPDDEKNSIREEVLDFDRKKMLDREKWLVSRGVPRKYWHMNPTQENEKARKAIESSMPFGLVRGERKTSSVCWFILERFDREYWCYISSFDLQISCEREDIREDLPFVDWAKQVKRLVIEDVGEETCRYGNVFIPSILMSRIDNDLETVITTGLNADSFAKYAPRIHKRIQNGEVIIINS